PRLVETYEGVVRTLADILDHAAERWDAFGGGETLSGAHAVESKRRGERCPGLGYGSRRRGQVLHHCRTLTAEMREIHPQCAEEARPAGFGAFKLLVPVVRAGEEAVHHADDADAS